MRKKFWILTAVVAVVAVGCAAALKPTKVLNATIPDDSFTKKEVAYGALPRQNMDIYLPRQPVAGKQPLIFIFGGAWRQGSKEDFLFVAEAFTALGHPVIIPNYRLYPTVQFPAMFADIADSIAYLQQQAPQLLGQPLQRYILMGHSSGAHSAALLATHPQHLRERGVTASMSALIGLSGPYDLPLELDEVSQVFGDVDPKTVNPTLSIATPMPPTLLMHGADDERVLPKHSRIFAAALEAKGQPVQLTILPNVDHVRILASLAAPLRRLNNSYETIQAFLKRCCP